jgi:hypothetical protein
MSDGEDNVSFVSFFQKKDEKEENGKPKKAGKSKEKEKKVESEAEEEEGNSKEEVEEGEGEEEEENDKQKKQNGKSSEKNAKTKGTENKSTKQKDTEVKSDRCIIQTFQIQDPNKEGEHWDLTRLLLKPPVDEDEADELLVYWKWADVNVFLHPQAKRIRSNEKENDFISVKPGGNGKPQTFVEHDFLVELLENRITKKKKNAKNSKKDDSESTDASEILLLNIKQKNNSAIVPEKKKKTAEAPKVVETSDQSKSKKRKAEEEKKSAPAKKRSSRSNDKNSFDFIATALWEYVDPTKVLELFELEAKLYQMKADVISNAAAEFKKEKLSGGSYDDNDDDNPF